MPSSAIMSSRRSIVRSVTRAHALTLLLSGALTAVVAGAASARVLIAQDDDAALALARTLGSELADHRNETWTELGELVSHEYLEQRWFRRDIEVWADLAHRLGGDGETGRLAAWSQGPEGCTNARVTGTWARVCVAHVERSPAAVVVASPISIILDESTPIVLVVSLTALLSAALFLIIGRSIILRALTPLDRFNESLAQHEGSPNARMPTLDWGAEEIDRLAAAFNGLLDRIAAVFEREQRFVANAAHELRTPLTRLRGQIELAADALDEEGSTSARLALAVRSCEELTRSTESLLALSRNEVDAHEEVDLGDLAGRMQDEARVSVQRESGVQVHGDWDLLALAVRNLVDNALKYADGDVRIVVRQTGECGEICVQDNGPGIPADQMERVREPFVRGADRDLAVRGSGLGLALVDHVARLHGGRLELRVRSPHGLAAAIVLPRVGHLG
jgi:signal transduction histidine kinase